MNKKLSIALIIIGGLATISVFAFRVATSSHFITRNEGSPQRITSPANDMVHHEMGGERLPQVAMSNNPSQTGEIVGRVLDDKGQPVSEATVSPVKINFSFSSVSPIVKTNINGEFKIKDMDLGRYKLSVSKEEDGYPDVGSIFYYGASATMPQVIVLGSKTTPKVLVKLGPKTPAITGRVMDAVANEPVPNVIITLRRVDDPKHFLLTGPNDLRVKGKFKILVPPVPFTIEVKALGYEDWTYSSDGTGKHKDALKLEREETKKLTIALRPVK